MKWNGQNGVNKHMEKWSVKQLTILKIKFKGFSHSFTKLGIQPQHMAFFVTYNIYTCKKYNIKCNIKCYTFTRIYVLCNKKY